MVDLGGPFQNLVGAKTGQQIDQAAQYGPLTIVELYIKEYIWRKFKKMFPEVWTVYVSRKSKNNICFIKDAHQFKDSIACPETSVRVCFGG